tara:strand:+ start:102 stop:902 length:801 start_codon:yes stop_codon:yes gene_type:complete
MSQNLVIANKDNRVVFVFGGIDLTLATDILVQFGAESYSKLLNPLIVVIDSATELSLDLSATAEVGKVFATVTYKDSSSVNGTDITSRELGNSAKIVVAIGSQLIIEDGTIVANANSFVTDAEFKAYANIRNFDIPATQPDREALLILALDYLQGKELDMKGSRVSATQELMYPRDGVCFYNNRLLKTDIPSQIKKAQMELAAQANESELLKTGTVQNLASIEIDGVYTETYFSGGAWEYVRTERADVYLNPLLVNNGSSNLMVRV